MLLIMLGGFIVASVIIEMMIVKQIPVLARLAGKYKLIGIGMSVGLSWLLGNLFAAGGAVVLIGSIASSVITQPMHWFRLNRQRCLDRTVGAWERLLEVVRGSVPALAKKIHLSVTLDRLHTWLRCQRGRIYTGWSSMRQLGGRL